MSVPCCRKKGKVAGFYSARSETIPPPPWTNFAPPFSTAVALALHEELGDTHRAIKMAMRWTGASERTVKYWFSGERGPSGDHLIALTRHSDAVLYVLLALAGRHVVEEPDD
jgi:hypothetical protein